MRDYNFRPNKRLGQNFIIDRNIVDKIIRIADFNPSDTVLEIGAGAGNITTEISDSVKSVIAVEFDKRLCEVIKKTIEGRANVELACGDILEFDIRPCAKKDKLRIIGNLPYYITTPVLEYIINNRKYIKDALLMVQKEVAERILAKPKGKAYGSITCYLGYYTKPEFKSIVKSTSFFPRPEVNSALIYFNILNAPPVSVNNEELFFKVIRGAFNQRRKTLLASLANKKISGLGREEIREALVRAGVSPQTRPEELGLEDFGRISNEFPG